MFSLLDQVPNIEAMLNDLEAYITNEGLIVMKTNYDTITTVI